MSKIRKAHSVEMIDRTLNRCEAVGVVDDEGAMTLIGLLDELSRVERKWLLKAADQAAGSGTTRPLADAKQLDHRFERLARLIAATVRRADVASPVRSLLLSAAGKLNNRTALSTFDPARH